MSCDTRGQGESMNNHSTYPRVWLVTGSSRGLGAEIVTAVLANGDAVVATARNAQAVIQRFGASASLLALDLDVRDEAAARRAVHEGIAHFGRIDIVVNNAGYGILGAVEEASAEEISAIFATNVFGLLNVTRAVLPQLRAQRSGHLINISSVGGYQSGPGFGIYCSTKFAVEGLSEALHGELLPLGIKVTLLEPGHFRTDFLDISSIIPSQSLIEDYAGTAGLAREMGISHNHKQSGDPKKLAQALLQLVTADKPPLRIQFGRDALRIVQAKNAFVEREQLQWQALATATDYL